MKKNSKSKIKSNSPLPLYFQIKEDLKSKIENGILNEGEYLPSEFKLMERYGVSRPTIRQAVENLCQENFLEKQRGIGTMVKSKNSRLSTRNLGDLLNFNKEAQKKSYISSTDVLEFCTVPSNPSLKEVFGDDVSSFYRIKRLRFLDHKPAELVTTYIPKYLIENLNDYDLTKNSLFDILEREKNIYVDYAEKLLRAVNVSKDVAKYLEIVPNTAVQFVHTVTYNTKGIPIEYSDAFDVNEFSNFKLIVKKNRGHDC